MTDGSFHNSDLTRPCPRRRAFVWLAVCLVLVVGLIASFASDGDWYALALALFPAVEGVRTARRLHRSGTG